MRMTRRTLLIGAGVGAMSVLLASCTPEPTPTPTPTRTPTDPPPTFAGPAPTHSMRSTWSTDPFSRGGVSFTPVGAQPSLRQALADPIEQRLFFAGEATDAHAPGTMRGAIRSGERAAIELRTRAAAGERIAVVGAGLAGAVAAGRLAADGAAVTVFEARDRLGGRIDSRVDDAWPLPVQLGGWMLSGDDTDLRERFATIDTRLLDLVDTDWRSSDGPVDPFDAAVVSRALEAAQAQPADIAVANALTAAGVDTEDPALAALLATVTAASGADADVQSSWFPPALPPESYAAPSADLTAFVESLLEGLEVSLSSPVTRVAYDDTGVSLRLGTGESLSFDRVVLTVPLGVLQHGGIEFSPALPFTHRGAIAELGVGAIETIWLRFDEAFWDTEAALWHVVDGDALIRTWFNLAPGTGEPVLVGLVGGEAAEEFAELGDQDAVVAALASLAPFIPAES
ncbi:flavin monoamine oxidase family protein [Microbacterium sp. GXF0217]